MKTNKDYVQIENKRDFLQALVNIKPTDIKLYDSKDGYFIKTFKVETEEIKLSLPAPYKKGSRLLTKAYYYILLGKKGDTIDNNTRFFKTGVLLNPSIIVDSKTDPKYHNFIFYGFKQKEESVSFDGLEHRAFWSIVKESFL
ncbi:hypothetical protein [Aquimarina aggregata]|uniref:hypothetical protein n=1 Tax=Aquimarina aggregata TaxID=1642818 RepID=UPI0024928DCB|nr:hypothetical protein [Aquimarina aggregata]